MVAMSRGMLRARSQSSSASGERFLYARSRAPQQQHQAKPAVFSSGFQSTSRNTKCHAAKLGADFTSPEVQIQNTIDFYQLLNVPRRASTAEIKRSYYNLQKQCHPDIYGKDGHDMCILLNEAYETLLNSDRREVYDIELELAKEDKDYTGRPLSKWTSRHLTPDDDRAVFVDEFSCIGCKQCVWAASATFRIEKNYGRSRVFAQWLNTEEDIQCAIDCCPVDCIHWVDKSQLPALEYITSKMDKVNVGIMMSSSGINVVDPFNEAESFIKKRRERLERIQKLSQKRARDNKKQSQSEDTLTRRKRAANLINDKTAERWERFWELARKGLGTIPENESMVPVAAYVYLRGK